jgi:transposase
MERKFKLIFGIDISKLTLDATYFFEGTPHYLQVPNNANGISQLVGTIRELGVDWQGVLVCCENTGSYTEKLSMVMKSLEVTFWVVHPIIMKGYRLDLQRVKNDKVDSLKIAEFALAHQHKATHFHHPDQKTKELKELCLLRKQLIGIRQRTLNFIASENDKAIPGILNTVIYDQLKFFLTGLIKDVEKSIQLLINSERAISGYYKILLSIPGVGPVIAQHILSVTDGFKKITDYKSFACYVGIAPFARSSGTSIKYRPRTSKKANQELKAEMHQGALSVIREGQIFYSYYKSMMDKGKHHLWIINSIMNMIAKCIFNLVTKMTEFNKEIFVKNKKSWQNNLVMS